MIDVDKEIDSRFLKEQRRRNSRLFLFHTFALGLTYYVLREMNVYYPYFLILGSLIFRYVFLRKESFNYSLFLLFVSVTALGWGLIFWYTYGHFGLLSVQSLVCMGVIVTMMSGGVTAFSSSLRASYVFYISITAIPFYLLVADEKPATSVLGLIFLSNSIYHLYHCHIGKSHLKRLFESEQKAIFQKETMQEFINAIPAMVAVIDENDKIFMMNKLYDEELGPSSENLEISQMVKDFRSGNQMNAMKEVHTSLKGEEAWYMVNLQRIQTPITGIVAAILPVTELVKTKNDLKIQEARSKYSAKLASLGEFSAGIAHEVNNPLTIIEGAVSLMKVMLEEPELDRHAIKKSCAKVLETTHRIAKIVKSLRTLSGNAEVEPFTNVSISSVLEPCLEISKSRLSEYNISLKVNLSDESVDLFGNEIQLSQVIMNLVSNAIDAVKDNAGERWIEIRYTSSAEWLDIFVIDNGKGVDKAITHKLMDPFFTTKMNEGTGLGLSISKTIAENHMGTLDYLPEEKYTTFRMRLPRMNPIIKESTLEEGKNVVLK